MRLIGFFDRGAALYPDHLFLGGDGGEFTYSEVHEASHRIAAGLAAAGLTHSSTAAVLSPNDSRAFTCVLGALRYCRWLPVNEKNAIEDNIHILNLVRSEALFFHSEYEEDIKAYANACPSIKVFVCVDREVNEIPCLADWAAGFNSERLERPQDGDDISTIWPTGGTTGKSKGVVTTNLNWETMIATFSAYMTYEDHPVHLVVAPMTHAAGVVIFALMARGCTNIMMARNNPLEVCRNIAAYRVTTLFMPPTGIYMMLSEPRVREFDYSSLKYFIYAAAPMSSEKLRLALNIFGPVMAQTYGQAESPMIDCFFSPQEHVAASCDLAKSKRLQSCGRPTMFTDLEIMNDEGEILSPGEPGEIVVRGNLVTPGYFEDPAATDAVREFGWHHTGDIGLKDKDGFVYIIDRKRDMIVTGGFNVFPTEVEQVIWSHPAVQDCAVVGVPDDKWGESVTAVVELRPNMSASAADIIELCRTRLGSVKAPKAVDFWDALPRSPVGKVLKRQIREEYWGGHTRRV